MAAKPSPLGEANRPRQYATIQTAAETLACSQRTVRRMIAAGELTGYRVGKRLLRVDLAELNARLRALPTVGDFPPEEVTAEVERLMRAHMLRVSLRAAQGRRRGLQAPESVRAAEQALDTATLELLDDEE
jgi:excisionase family DNA binding protein